MSNSKSVWKRQVIGRIYREYGGPREEVSRKKYIGRGKGKIFVALLTHRAVQAAHVQGLNALPTRRCATVVAVHCTLLNVDHRKTLAKQTWKQKLSKRDGDRTRDIDVGGNCAWYCTRVLVASTRQQREIQQRTAQFCEFRRVRATRAEERFCGY